MFEKMFTTKMSSDGKELQRRFTQIRSGAGKKARIMSAVMTAAILSVTTLATAALAAVGSDGLEHWTHNEILYRDGVSFRVNVSGQNVPAWVTNEVAGGDGNVNVTITRYETRNMRGQVQDDHLIEMSGANGSVRLACGSWSMLNETQLDAYYESRINPDILNYKYITELSFQGFTGAGWNFESRPISSLVTGSREGKRAGVHFGIDENKKIRAAYIMFRNADTTGNATDEIFSTLKTETLSYYGDFEASYINDCTSEADTNYYFMRYEDNYVNAPCDSVSFEITDASAQNGISIRSSITLPDAARAGFTVYNKNGREVSTVRSVDVGSGVYTRLTPIKGRILRTSSFDTSGSGLELEPAYPDVEVEEYDIPENHFVSGEQYRVCAVVFDENYTVLYRWQQYVTMK